MRLRLIGGRVAASSLRALVDVAEEYGDGRVHVTGRANLQLRGLPSASEGLAAEVLDAIEATGLLPTRTHELVRNVMASPALDRPDARWDAVLDELDRLLRADPELAHLPGRFLFVLDDGRGDLIDRSCDLGLVVVAPRECQLRIGDRWGPVVPLDAAPAHLARLAREFVQVRGTGPAAPWHVVELPGWGRVPDTPGSVVLGQTALHPPDPRLPPPAGPLPYGERHLAVPEDGLDRAAIEALPDVPLIVTPWRGLLLPAPTSEETA